MRSLFFKLILVIACWQGGMKPIFAQRLDRPDFFEQGIDQLETEIRRLEQQQSAPSTALTIDTGVVPWTQVLLKEGNCSVQMPQGSIVYDTQRVETSRGVVEFNLVSTNPPSMRFVVAASESLDQSFLADPEQLLTQVRDRIVQKQNNFTLQETDTVEFQGYPAKDFILKSNEETLTFRLFLARDHLYILAVGQKSEISSVNFITEFFESFQFL